MKHPRRPLDDWNEVTEEDPLCKEALEQHRRRIDTPAPEDIRTLRAFRPPPLTGRRR